MHFIPNSHKSQSSGIDQADGRNRRMTMIADTIKASLKIPLGSCSESLCTVVVVDPYSDPKGP